MVIPFSLSMEYKVTKLKFKIKRYLKFFKKIMNKK